MTRKMRGYQVAPTTAIASIIEAKNEGADILRYQVLSYTQDIEVWKSEVASQVNYFLTVKNTFSPVQVVMDLHKCPNENRLENLKWFWNMVWTTVGSSVVYGILNEPDETVARNKIIMTEMVKFIRKLSPSIIISVTCPYSDPQKFRHTPYIEKDPNIWYEFHYYMPDAFTAQGIAGKPTGKKYPSPRNDSKQMLKNLQQVTNFKAAHPSAQIYVGEFSCVDFADDDSRAAYTKDCIINFKRLSAHFTWHAWREWEHWQPSGKTLTVLRNNML